MTSLGEIIKTLNDKSVNNHSYLTRAVGENDIESIQKIIELGGNVHGVTSTGLTRYTPLTSIDFRTGKFGIILRLLLRNGADINGQDTRGHTILTSYFDFMFNTFNYQNEKFLDILFLLLERGANPDGTIFYNPLSMIIQVLPFIKSNYHGIVYNVCEILIAYGANPKSSFIVLDKYKSNIRTDSYIMNDALPYKWKKLLKKLFNLDVKTVVKDCESRVLLTSLAKFYKIPHIEGKINKEEICKCVKTINQNKDSYDEEKFIEMRKKSRKEQCSNDDLLIGSSVDSFPSNELIYLHEKKPDFTYCFHVSEIPILLSNKKNPYNNKDLEPDFVDDLLTKYKYFLPKTLEESLKELFVFSETKIDNDVLINKLGFYIKGFNSYIQPEKIKSLNLNNIIEIQNMLYGGNKDLIKRMVNPVDRVAIWGESLNDTKNRIIERTITHLLIHIREEDNKIPFVSNVVDQLLKDSEVSNEIIDLFPVSKRNNIINLSRYSTYKNFIDGVIGIVLPHPRDIPLITVDRKFRNYLSDDQLAVIDFIDIKDVVTVYKRYIQSSIEEILKTRFGDTDINIAWNDTVPSLIRLL